MFLLATMVSQQVLTAGRMQARPHGVVAAWLRSAAVVA